MSTERDDAAIDRAELARAEDKAEDREVGAADHPYRRWGDPRDYHVVRGPYEPKGL